LNSLKFLESDTLGEAAQMPARSPHMRATGWSDYADATTVALRAGGRRHYNMRRHLCAALRQIRLL